MTDASIWYSISTALNRLTTDPSSTFPILLACISSFGAAAKWNDYVKSA